MMTLSESIGVIAGIVGFASLAGCMALIFLTSLPKTPVLGVGFALYVLCGLVAQMTDTDKPLS